MLIRIFFLFFVFIFVAECSVYSQTSVFRCRIKDSVTKETLAGVTAIVSGTSLSNASDGNGIIEIKDIPDGDHTINFSFVGYKKDSLRLSFPLKNDTGVFQVALRSDDQELEEVIVSSTRTNARIEDLPMKVEVLGQEEMNEESTLVPGNVSSILGDISIITIQRTNPVNGNDAVRMQGLDPQYTQLMRDGLPLYGGFSGSLGVLSIPPLDLKQIEIIKGSASTLYGGGAIAGLINFISKTPVDSPETTLLLNYSSLNEANANTFISRKYKKTGFTFFAGANEKRAVDVNKDGFSEVPEDKNFSVHPRFFYYISEKSQLNFGITSVYDKRRSGDMFALKNGVDSVHPFLETDKSYRNTFDAQYSHDFSKAHSLTVKSALGLFNRDILLQGSGTKGLQNSSYSEINDRLAIGKNVLTAGINFSSKSLKVSNDTGWVNDFSNNTVGFFAQDDWNISEKLMLETGLRYDLNTYSGNFLLPRIALFYKPNTHWSVRLASGTGYKSPDILSLTDPSPLISNYNSIGVKSEKSYGVNADINYRTLLWNELSVQLNQAFYYTNITNPVILSDQLYPQVSLANGTYEVNSYGTDTYIRLKYNTWELYLGYNHTEAFQQFDTDKLFWQSEAVLPVAFNPKDKFSATLAYEIESKWRMGVESSLTANQYIYSNQRVPDFWFVALMVERKFKFGSLVLNCENLTDSRQSKIESLVEGTTITPVFKPVWGQIEGRVVNLALKIKL